jgi:hypothetical protein
VSNFPSRRSEAQSRARSHAKAQGASYDEPQEKPWPVRVHRRPREGELQAVLDGVPERLARRLAKSES